MQTKLALFLALATVGCGSSGSSGSNGTTGSDAGDDSATSTPFGDGGDAASTPSGDAAADGGSDAPLTDAPVDAATSTKRGFPTKGPWVSYYGSATGMGDLSKVASTFAVINIDADPGAANFDSGQITTLKNDGKNRVISYFDLGSCENYRDWWSFSGITAPSGFVSCNDNKKAQRGAYSGYPDEVWMDVGDADYQHLLVDFVAPRLMATGVDGFFLDNLEIIEHGTSTTNGPCDAACAQGGLDLVRKLREKFPDALIVMQNATSDVTRLGKTGGLAFPSLLDGISHEEVYAPAYDGAAESQLGAWLAMGLSPGGRAFWVATEDYVGDCTQTAAAKAAYDKSRAKGFSPYATDASAGQKVVCYWGF